MFKKAKATAPKDEFLDPIEALGDFDDEPEFGGPPPATTPAPAASRTAAILRQSEFNRMDDMTIVSTVRVLAETLHTLVSARSA